MSGLIPPWALLAQSLRICSAGFTLQQGPLVLWVGEDEETPLPCSLNYSMNCVTAGTQLGLGAVWQRCHFHLPIGWISGSGN